MRDLSALPGRNSAHSTQVTPGDAFLGAQRGNLAGIWGAMLAGVGSQ